MIRSLGILSFLGLLLMFSGIRAAQTSAPGSREPHQEVINGLTIELSSSADRQGQPKLTMRLRNAGAEALDFVEYGPLFLEVEGAGGHWRSFQHSRWRSDKVDTAHRFEPGHVESETEPLSAFVSLPPGQYQVRIAVALDAGMLGKYESKKLWTGAVKSNSVAVNVPAAENAD